MKNYKSSKERLNESRVVYTRIVNEQRRSFDNDGEFKPKMGIPGQCCDGGPDCIPVTFASATENCSTLGYDDCTHSDCQGTVGPVGVELGVDDILDLEDLDTGDVNAMISCVMCMNGSAVSVTQVPAGQPCPPGTQDSHLGDPCDGQNQPCGPSSFNVNSSCASNANMVQNWAGPAGPVNFLANMNSGFNQFGCQFLQARLANHQSQLANNVFTGPNNPQGYQNPGPLWVAQKTSKVDFLQCIISSCCGNQGGPVSVGPTMG